MDYGQLSVGELREACQARGLGTARSRAELIQRLTDADAEHRQPSLAEGERVLSGDAVRGAAETAAFEPPTTAGPFVFRKTFDAEPDGPDEETHLAYRQGTIDAAAKAGLTPRGDARLAETGHGVWVYEVSVRQVMQP
jgi:hypothetical protein